MPDQPPSDRFKAEAPQIPGVSGTSAHPSTVVHSSFKLVVGLLAALLVVFIGAHWALFPKHREPKAAEQQPQIEVPSPAPDPRTLLPHATEASPDIANVDEMAKAWSSKEFLIRGGLNGEDVPALLVRLPTGSGLQASGYWAFSLNSPYGNCRLEYVTDLAKLRNDYDYRVAKHPMVGNPCSRTVFDPLKMSELTGKVFVRGGIVQGSDLRPPLGIEIQVRGKDVLAIRSE
jgi:hypothetical protein